MRPFNFFADNSGRSYGRMYNSSTQDESFIYGHPQLGSPQNRSATLRRFN